MRLTYVVVVILIGLQAAILAKASNNTAINNTVSNTTQAAQPVNIFEQIRRAGEVMGSGGGSVFYIVGTAIAVILILYIWYYPSSVKKAETAEARFVRLTSVKPPKGYDFIAYVVDESEKVIRKERFLKIGDSLYISTNVSSPTFLYTPDHVDTYLCTDGKSMVPCGLAYKQGLLSMIVDPRLAGLHDLSTQAGLISLEEGELDKLLSTLYIQGEKKIGIIPITPGSHIAFTFNLRNMIKGYLSILRSADEMMIHFLHTANQAESIQNFMKAAARLQQSRFSWLQYVALMIMAIAIGIGIVQVLSRGAVGG